MVAIYFRPSPNWIFEIFPTYMISPPRVCLISSKKFIPPIKIQFITRWFQVFRQTKNTCDILKGNFFSSRFSSITTSSTSKMPQFSSCHFKTGNCSILLKLHISWRPSVLCHTKLANFQWNSIYTKYAHSIHYLKNMNGNYIHSCNQMESNILGSFKKIFTYDIPKFK